MLCKGLQREREEEPTGRGDLFLGERETSARPRKWRRSVSGAS